jgi:hypothetical protein
MRGTRHVAHMRKRKNIYQVSGGKLEGKRPFRILSCRWKSNIKSLF